MGIIYYYKVIMLEWKVNTALEAVIHWTKSTCLSSSHEDRSGALHMLSLVQYLHLPKAEGDKAVYSPEVLGAVIR